MPQKAELADEWKTMLGAEWKEIQQSWLHRLGNLTLSGFNPDTNSRSID